VSHDLTALGPTLRAWRDRLSPAAAGLPAGRTRRSTGLRREEVAELAGVSVDYLVRLEQGRSTTPSAQVVGALARTLQLSDDERDHLHRLAGLAAPSQGHVSRHIPRGVQRVLHRLDGSAAAVFAADWQLIWSNPGWSALFGDQSCVVPDRRNFAKDTFPVDDSPPGLSQWPVISSDQHAVEAAVVSDLRRATGRFPTDPQLARLVSELLAGSARFAELWAAGTVGAHREDHKIVEHPGVGPITVDCDVLSDGEAELKIVVLTAEPGSEDETRLRLAVVAGVHPAAAR
jgi:transcriptional regulator with XRE-family HTH domain